MISRFVLSALLVAVLGGAASAQDDPTRVAAKSQSAGWIDPGWRRTVAKYSVTFEEDGSSKTIFDFEILLTEAKGLRSVAQQVFSYNSHFEDLNLSDLATLKTDGRAIPVDPRAINDQPAYVDPSAPYFDEQRIKTIVYADVVPGDRVRGRLVYSSKRPRFPDAFADVWIQRQDWPPETIELILNGPVSRPLRVNAIGVEHTQEQIAGRVVHHAMFRHETPKVPLDATGGFDAAKRFEASTFADYASFATLLSKWNAPMAVPDAGIRRLAQEIVGDAVDERLMAERIFNWVAKNIRYAGIGFADGGYVSQPAPETIRARYGDCKAHATVLKALLAAQGIEADLTLVNHGSNYTITGVATPNFDHAIVYVPKFDIYLDPTAGAASFRAMPKELYGKPVLNIDRAVISKIPPSRPDDFVVRTNTSVTFDARGMRKGESTLWGQGIGAKVGRVLAERLENEDARRAAEKRLQREGFEGAGSYSFPDPREPSDSYAISASFELTRPMSLDRESRVRLFVSPDLRPGPWEIITGNVQARAFRCVSVDYTEASSIELPDGVNLAEKPIDVAYIRALAGETRYGVVTGEIRLDGNAVVEGRIIRATYRVRAAFDAAVCPAAFSVEVMQLLQKGAEFRRSTIAITPKPVARVLERGSTYETGLAAYRSGNYLAALKEWLPIADLGDTGAQVYLGSMYKDGKGVAQDYRQAVAWYSKAAERGDALAQANLGFMYANGLGVGVDEALAARLYRSSADLGEAYSQCSLAEMYENGKGVAQDYSQAMFWYTKAAEQGYGRAAVLLASMYEKGKGVAPDYARANEWYHKAAERGYALAQLNLGMLYADGHGVERDYKQAVDWFRKAANQGNAIAQYNLGYAYEGGYGVRADEIEAKQWYARAANHQGHAGASDRLNSLRMQDNVIGALKRAIGRILQ